jgi:hypothetical protein
MKVLIDENCFSNSFGNNRTIMEYVSNIIDKRRIFCTYCFDIHKNISYFN